MSSSSTWTAKQNKLFENALAIYDKMEAAERWQYLARAVGGNKTIEEIKEHYQNLVEDVNKIESGEVPLPNYAKLGHSSCMDDNQRLRNLKL